MSEAPFARVVALVGKDGRPISNPAAAEEISGDALEVIIGAGSDQGVVEGMRFVIYENGEELFDPVTKESLGTFEIVKGKARATHVQARQSRIRSTSTRRLPEPFRLALTHSNADSDYKIVAVPFKGIKIGDIVRPI